MMNALPKKAPFFPSNIRQELRTAGDWTPVRGKPVWLGNFWKRGRIYNYCHSFGALKLLILWSDPVTAEGDRLIEVTADGEQWKITSSTASAFTVGQFVRLDTYAHEITHPPISGLGDSLTRSKA